MDPTARAYVVDASVVVKWYLQDEELSEQAGNLYRGHVEREHILIAPAHIHCEVPSAIVAATRRTPARISIEEGRIAVEEFLAMNIRAIPNKELVLDSYAQVLSYDVNFYDALYLALSEQLSVPLVTADAKFYRRVSTRSDVLWLRDIPDA